MRLRWVLVAATLSLPLVACGDDGPDAAPAPEAVVVTPALTPLPDAEVVARAGAAVWRVATDGCDWLGSGSAFAVDPHHLVTNRHVIANDTSPTLVSPSGDERSGRVIGLSEDVDVAVVEVDDELPVTLQWAPTDALQPGEHVVVLGYPAPALEFTTTVGSIVNFQGRAGTREAMLTDAPIAPGNSGGPGLRADATVAGVVTQMTLDDPSQRAAIVFSAASVEAVVDAFIAEPDDDVLSDCGLGPDYVPPLPDHFDVPTPPPPPPTTATTAPLPRPTVPTPTVTTATTRPTTTTSSTSSTTSTRVACPAGGLAMGIEGVVAEPGPDEGTWRVTVQVVLANDAAAPIDVTDIRVVVDGVEGHISLDDAVVEPGSTARFDVEVRDRVVADEAPTEAAGTTEWRWLDAPGCPTEPAAVDQPTPAAD